MSSYPRHIRSGLLDELLGLHGLGPARTVKLRRLHSPYLRTLATVYASQMRGAHTARTNIALGMAALQQHTGNVVSKGEVVRYLISEGDLVGGLCLHLNDTQLLLLLAAEERERLRQADSAAATKPSVSEALEVVEPRTLEQVQAALQQVEESRA